MPTNEWACKICTFINESTSTLRCDACGLPKGSRPTKTDENKNALYTKLSNRKSLNNTHRTSTTNQEPTTATTTTFHRDVTLKSYSSNDNDDNMSIASAVLKDVMKKQHEQESISNGNHNTNKNGFLISRMSSSSSQPAAAAAVLVNDQVIIGSNNSSSAEETTTVNRKKSVEQTKQYMKEETAKIMKSLETIESSEEEEQEFDENIFHGHSYYYKDESFRVPSIMGDNNTLAGGTITSAQSHQSHETITLGSEHNNDTQPSEKTSPPTSLGGAQSFIGKLLVSQPSNNNSLNRTNSSDSNSEDGEQTVSTNPDALHRANARLNRTRYNYHGQHEDERTVLSVTKEEGEDEVSEDYRLRKVEEYKLSMNEIEDKIIILGREYQELIERKKALGDEGGEDFLQVLKHARLHFKNKEKNSRDENICNSEKRMSKRIDKTKIQTNVNIFDLAFGVHSKKKSMGIKSFVDNNF